MQTSGAIPGYSIQRRIEAELYCDSYAAVRDTDERQVLLLVFHPGEAGHARAERQYALLRSCPHACVPEALELRREGEFTILVLDRAPGVRLSSFVQCERPTPQVVLDLALKLTEVVQTIHAAGVLHRAISPKSVRVIPERGDVHLTHFECATSSNARQASSRAGVSAAASDPAFAAPEQSGRINHGVDARTDLYALGATLYYALTGGPPFTYSSPERLVLAHIAEPPRAPHAVSEQVPVALGRVVMKLLAKEPAERYRSARALKSDLERLRALRDRAGAWPSDFVAGAHDATEGPAFSARLYGREDALARLREAYAKARSGRVQAVFVGGPAGAGKSALVTALGRDVVADGGWLVRGCYNGGGDEPYAGWTQALRTFVTQLLQQSDQDLARWGRLLRDELGGVAGALVEVVPDLGFVIGETPRLPRVGPREAQARIALALERFLQVSATPDHPLAIFLDDAQFSDPASLSLLEGVLAADHFGALLLIVAYRSSELRAGHALLASRDAYVGRSLAVESLELGGLDPEATCQLIADALGRTPGDVAALADRIGRVTGHLPLLVREAIEALFAAGALRREADGWHFDGGGSADFVLPEGAVRWMAERIGRQPLESRRILELASCIPGEFTSSDLSLLLEQGEDDAASESVRVRLEELVQNGFLVTTPTGHRFANERLREAAGARMAPDERAHVHLSMGRNLLEAEGNLGDSPRVFELADHLANAISVLPEELKLAVIDVHLSAGQRALATGAPANAAHYLNYARSRFGEDDWESLRSLGFALHLEMAEAALQTEDPERALAVLSELDRRQPSEVEFATVAAKRIAARAMLDPPEVVAAYALGVLRRLGISWPVHPSHLRARHALWRVQRLLGKRSLRTAMHPARAVSPRWIAQMLVITACAAPFSRTDARLAALMVAYVGREYLTTGFVSSPIATLAGLAMFAATFQGEDRLARAYADAVQYFEQQIPDPALSLRAKLYLHTGYFPWFSSRRACLPPLEKAARAAIEGGDTEYACYARSRVCFYRILLGDPVEATQQRLDDMVERLRRVGHGFHATMQHFADAHRVLGQHKLEGDLLESSLRRYEHALDVRPCSSEPEIRTVWLLVLCVVRRFERALEVSDALGERLYHVSPWVHVADHLLFRGIAASEVAKHAGGRVRRQRLRQLRVAQAWLRERSHRGPDFLHMTMLLDAERHVHQRNAHAAVLAYQRSAERALQEGFVHHAALAYEQQGWFEVSCGKPEEARKSFFSAAGLYAGWGALAKSNALLAAR